MRIVFALLAVAVFAAACGDADTIASATTSTASATTSTVSATDRPAGDGSAQETGSTETTVAGSGPESTGANPSDAGSTTVTSAPAVEQTPVDSCQPGPVPDAAALDPFYAQGCDLDGFWVVAADEVDPGAIITAAKLISVLFSNDQLLADTLRSTDIRLGIIGQDQRTTEMPEYRDLNEVFPDTDWDTRARGLGATLERPLVSAGEENVLCLAGDRYRGEDILLHEFAHVLHEWGYATIDPTFQPRLEAAYADAINRGVWASTYAAENEAEYWAEAIQSYFGRNLTAEVSDGIHGPIDTRAELAEADPTISALIEEKLGSVELPASCNS